MFATRAIRLVGLGVLAALVLAAGPAAATPPPAAKLLPSDTGLVVTIHNVQDLVKGHQNTAIGRMSQDPQIRPLIQRLYGIAGEIVALAKEQLGLSLSEMLAIPQGEVTFALIAPDGEKIDAVFFLDAGEQVGTARALLKKAEEGYAKDGMEVRQETIGQTKVSLMFQKNNKKQDGGYFEREGLICVARTKARLQQVLAAWDGQAESTLADNERYATIVSRCEGGMSRPPQVLVYADPIALTKAAIRDNPNARQARMAVVMLPVLGLDGLKAVGASVAFDAPPFDAIMQGHLLLDNPRTGVLDVIAFDPGDLTPEPWVPNDVSAYFALRWDFKKSLTKVGSMVDSFWGDGFFAKALGGYRTVGIDVESEILPSLDGRVTMIQWIEEPITIQSQNTLLAFRLKDPKLFAKAFDRVMEKETANEKDAGWVKRSFGGKTYYQVVSHQFDNLPPEQRPPVPSPCMGVVDNQFMFSIQTGIFLRVLRTMTESQGSLADEPDFKLVAGKISRLSGGRKPSVLTFDRPEESMRFLYTLVTGEKAREFYRSASAGVPDDNPASPFLKSFNAALDEHPLPPFSALQRYLAPGGGFVIDDETGLHYTAFSLRRKTEAKTEDK